MARRVWTGRIFLSRDENGKQRFYWVGRFSTKRERDDAVARARTERPWEAQTPDQMTCDEWAERYLARYAETRKASSLDTAERALKRFRSDFGARAIGSLAPIEVEDWVGTVPRWAVPQVVAMFNYAKRMRVIGHNPFDGLSHRRGPGRANQDPPTPQQLERLLDACDALGDYGSQMRALITFAAYTGMRPGELYELRWTDIDLAASRINVSRRIYRGSIDVPKSGKAKRIALPPPARDALLKQPTRTGELVFVSKNGRRLSASTTQQYFAIVRAAAGLDCDFYLATKHLGVHMLYREGLSTRAIAAQCGWSEKAVDQLLTVYGHADLVALTEIDALYKANQSDADVTQEASNAR